MGFTMALRPIINRIKIDAIRVFYVNRNDDFVVHIELRHWAPNLIPLSYHDRCHIVPLSAKERDLQLGKKLFTLYSIL